MRENLEMAEQRWRKRTLFTRPRRRRVLPWLLITLAIALSLVLWLQPELVNSLV